MGKRRLQITIDTQFKDAGVAQAIKSLDGFVSSLGKADSALSKFTSDATRLGGVAAPLDKIKPSADNAKEGIEGLGKSTGLTADIMDKLIGGGVILGLGSQMIEFGKKSLATASAVDEATSKFAVVFGEFADSAMKDLELLAQQTGRSKNDFIGFAATLQDTFVPLGFARDEAAKMSTQLVRLSTDLSSFNNIPVQQVVEDLQSALVGNTETLRKYGIVAQETQIKQEALNLGLYSGKGVVDAQAKAQAILSLAIKGTTDAQGDAIRTANSYENTQRSLESAMTDLEVATGHLLQPMALLWTEMATRGVNALTMTVNAMAELSPTTTELVAKNQDLAQSTGSPIEATKKLTDGLNVLNDEYAKVWKSTNQGDMLMNTLTAVFLKASGAGNDMKKSLEELTIASISHIDTTKNVNSQQQQVMQSLKATYGEAYKLEAGMVTLNGVEVTSIDNLTRMAVALQETAAFTTAFNLTQQIGANILEANAQATMNSTESVIALGDATKDFTDRQGEENKKLSESERAKLEAAHADENYANGKKKLVQASEEAAAAEEANRIKLEKFTEATHQAEEAMRKAAEVASGDYFTAAMEAGKGQGFFNQSLADLGEHYYTISGKTAQQADDLATLQDQYSKAQSTIHDYEVGIKGLGLSEEERASKIQEQVDAMALLEGAMQPLASITDTYGKATVTATINQDAVNQAIYDAADAAGASSVELALLGGALGLYSEEALNAALQSALIQAEIDKLATAYANGQISVTNMREELSAFIANLDETATSALSAQTTLDNIKTTGDIAAEGMNNAALAAKELADNIAAIPDKTVTVTTNYTETGTPPAFGPDSQKIGATTPTKFASGGLVTGGVPGRDSVPAMLMPGERVLTVQQNKQFESGMTQQFMGGTQNNTFNTQSSIPVMMQQMNELARMNQMSSGMGW